MAVTTSSQYQYSVLAVSIHSQYQYSVPAVSTSGQYQCIYRLIPLVSQLIL